MLERTWQTFYVFWDANENLYLVSFVVYGSTDGLTHLGYFQILLQNWYLRDIPIGPYKGGQVYGHSQTFLWIRNIYTL